MRRSALTICVALAALAAVPAAAAAAAPTATTEAATAVTGTTATLNGSVDPNQDATTYYFEYGTTAAYGSRTPDAGPLMGNAPRSVSADVTGLAPLTTYHFRVVARNAAGTVRGADLTFTTTSAAAPPAPVTITATPAKVTFGRATTIAGRVTGAGPGVKVTLEQTPFPYTSPFTTALTGETTGNGAYSFQVAPTVNTKYHVEAKSSPPATSADVIVGVRPRVTLRLSDRTPDSGERVRFSGRVLPAHDGKEVRLQRRTSSGWKTVRTPLLKPATPVNGVARSRYSTRLRVFATRTYRTVFVPGDGDHIRGKSRKRQAIVG